MCSLADAQSALQTADSLLATGRYLAARVAYERVLFAADTGIGPGHVGLGDAGPAASGRAALGKANCLKQQGLYASAAAFLTGQAQPDLPDSLRRQLVREQILCAYLAGQFENTLSLLDRLRYLNPDQPETPFSVSIKILSLNELQRWPEAAESYRQLQLLAGADTTQPGPYRHLPRLKSESKAQWLSTFIPGAGQLYAGKPAEAALSVLVQSAGLYFGVTSFLQAYYLSAWGVGAGLFGSFHAGGIRRAGVLVRQYNQKRVAAFNAQARQHVLDLTE
jgi:tetratricopeptide (TPR) repeat protein